ncbi:MAG: hypothetical protein E7415_02775 [Ruminococcaceae bacterium]|nr:hypothetical protein [Oscillospiraceae bacterium]
MNSEVKQVSLKEMFPLIEEQLKNGGTVTFKPHGISMLPLIRQGRDSVTLTQNTAQLKKNDIAFYRRRDGSFVLHRIVKVLPDNTFTMCGDNQTILEPGIAYEQVIGVATGINRDSSFHSVNSLYMKLFCLYAKIRRWFRKSLLKRAIRWGLRKCKIRK